MAAVIDRLVPHHDRDELLHRSALIPRKQHFAIPLFGRHGRHAVLKLVMRGLVLGPYLVQAPLLALLGSRAIVVIVLASTRNTGVLASIGIGVQRAGRLLVPCGEMPDDIAD